jgi:2'-5' RNA ligase
VAALVPPPADVEVDGLRRAAGDRALVRIAPHVTLAPPTNVGADDVPAALGVLRAAAAAQPGALALELGPVTTFSPPNRVAFLAVGGPSAADLERLQDALAAGPFARPRTRPFVPHVTVRADLHPPRRDAWIAAGADYHRSVEVGHVHLLEQRADADGRRWEVLADAPLGPPVVVGRGGLPVELTEHGLVDPEVAALGVPADEPGLRPDPAAVVVVARRHGSLAGVVAGRLVGTVVHVHALVVAPGERRTGVGTRLVEVLDRAAARRGAAHLEVVVGDEPGAVAFLGALGFTGPAGAPTLGRAVRSA